MMEAKKKDVVQTKNPKTDRYVKRGGPVSLDS